MTKKNTLVVIFIYIVFKVLAGARKNICIRKQGKLFTLLAQDQHPQLDEQTFAENIFLTLHQNIQECFHKNCSILAGKCFLIYCNSTGTEFISLGFFFFLLKL